MKFAQKDGSLVRITTVDIEWQDVSEQDAFTFMDSDLLRKWMRNQRDEPTCEFVAGEMIQVRDYQTEVWTQRVFMKQTEGSTRVWCGMENCIGYPVMWKLARHIPT